MTGLRPGAEGGVRAVVSFYGPSDLVQLVRTSRRIPDAIRNALEGTAWEGLVLAGLHDLSPVNFIGQNSPPFLLIHGTADDLVPLAQWEEMCDKLRRAGAACELYPVKNGGHGLRWWESVRLTDYKDYMVRWLEKERGNGSTARSGR